MFMNFDRYFFIERIQGLDLDMWDDKTTFQQVPIKYKGGAEKESTDGTHNAVCRGQKTDSFIIHEPGLSLTG